MTHSPNKPTRSDLPEITKINFVKKSSKKIFSKKIKQKKVFHDLLQAKIPEIIVNKKETIEGEEDKAEEKLPKSTSGQTPENHQEFEDCG